MAAVATLTKSKLDDLPAHVRSQMIDKMIARESERRIANWLQTEHKVKISSVQVGNYRRKYVIPALQTAAKLQEAKLVKPDVAERAVETKELAKSSLVASRLESRVVAKYDRYERWLVKAEADGDLRTATAIDQAETRTMQLDAELAGLANQQITVNQTANIVVMPSPNEQAQVATPPTPQLEPPTIDAEFIDINSAT